MTVILLHLLPDWPPAAYDFQLPLYTSVAKSSHGTAQIQLGLY
jgi:hypothetical protein